MKPVRGSELLTALRLLPTSPEQEREEAAAHRSAFGDGGDAFEGWRVGVGADAVAEDVDDRRAARAVCVVGVGAVDQAGVVERSLAGLQLYRHGLEPALLP